VLDKVATCHVHSQARFVTTVVPNLVISQPRARAWAYMSRRVNDHAVAMSRPPSPDFGWNPQPRQQAIPCIVSTRQVAFTLTFTRNHGSRP
jgi:hypothetical protein